MELVGHPNRRKDGVRRGTPRETDAVDGGKLPTSAVASAVRALHRDRGQPKNEELVKLIVGLGNPGIEYQFTPHNMGFLAIDRLAERCGVRVDNRHCRAATARARVAEVPVLLAKPETYMNLSGMSVAALVQEYEADPEKELIVIYDDLDLPFGSVRIRERGSAGSHNGMKSVIGALETQEFLRIRLGIAPEHVIAGGREYVLSPWRSKLDPTVDEMLDAAADAVEIILRQGPGAAMTRFNRKVPPQDAAEQPRKEE